MIRLAFGVTIAAIAIIAVAFFASPAKGQDCTYPIDTVVGEIIEKGGELIDLVDVRSDHYDQMLIVIAGNILTIGMAKDGCMVSPPLPIDSVEPVTPA